jgi:hypothetical protein
VLHCESWALVISAPASSVISSDVVLQSPLVAQTKLLQGCMSKVGRFLKRAEVALCRLSYVRYVEEQSYICVLLVRLVCYLSLHVGIMSSSVSVYPVVLSTMEGEAIDMSQTYL